MNVAGTCSLFDQLAQWSDFEIMAEAVVSTLNHLFYGVSYSKHAL